MKKIGVALVSIGLLAIVFFVFADKLQIGLDKGVGAMQILGIQVGVWSLLLGFGFVFIQWSGELNIKKSVQSFINQIDSWPIIVWILIPFVIELVLFFIFPMFFSKIKIQYFTKYIPDAYITHIGFDIESTVSRVANWLVSGQSPYADGFLLYTPLVFVLFAPLSILGYPAYYKLVVLLSLVSYCLLFIIALRIIEKKNFTIILLFFLTGLLSYGFQFELERGQFNIITYFLTFLAIYIFHYHYKYRYFSYILFALAIQLKLYPIIYIFMFVNDWRDWKSNIKRFIGIVILNFSLLFVLGYDFFITFLDRVTGYQLHYQSSRAEDLSITGFVYNLIMDGFNLIPKNMMSQLAQYEGTIKMIFLFVFGGSLLTIIVYAYIQKQNQLNPYLFLICTIGAMIIPSQSADYKLSILIVTLSLALASIPMSTKGKKKITQIILIFIASAAYWTTLYPSVVKPYLISRNFLALFIILLSFTMINVLVEGKYETREVEYNEK